MLRNVLLFRCSVTVVFDLHIITVSNLSLQMEITYISQNKHNKAQCLQLLPKFTWFSSISPSFLSLILIRFTRDADPCSDWARASVSQGYTCTIERNSHTLTAPRWLWYTQLIRLNSYTTAFVSSSLSTLHLYWYKLHMTVETCIHM